MKKVTFHCDGPDPMKEFIDDPTLPAPLLTQKEAQALLTVLGEGPLREGCLVPPVQALADGRTACVRVLTEDECRAEFERWIGAPPFEHMCDRMSESSSWRGQYKRYETQLAWCAWIECARAMGAVR